MTTPTPERWTAETEELVARVAPDAIAELLDAIEAGHLPEDYDTEAATHEADLWADLWIARQILTALADAGVLKEVRDEDVA